MARCRARRNSNLTDALTYTSDVPYTMLMAQLASARAGIIMPNSESCRERLAKSLMLMVTLTLTRTSTLIRAHTGRRQRQRSSGGGRGHWRRDDAIPRRLRGSRRLRSVAALRKPP